MMTYALGTSKNSKPNGQHRKTEIKKKKSSAVIDITLMRKIHTHVITMTGKSGYIVFKKIIMMTKKINSKELGIQLKCNVIIHVLLKYSYLSISHPQLFLLT